MHIQARLRIAFDPAVPRHARRLVTTCRHIFDHFRVDGKTGGRETETRTRRQMRAAAVVKADVGSVAVIALFLAYWHRDTGPEDRQARVIVHLRRGNSYGWRGTAARLDECSRLPVV